MEAERLVTCVVEPSVPSSLFRLAVVLPGPPAVEPRQRPVSHRGLLGSRGLPLLSLTYRLEGGTSSALPR